MTRNKKLIGIIASVTAIAAVAATWAYYTSDHSIDNTMSTGTYGDRLTEIFTPDTKWEPGSDADKIVGVSNTGDYDLVVRIAMSETWDNGTETVTVDSSNSEFLPTVSDDFQDDANDGSIEKDNSVVSKALFSDDSWTYGNDGYWYYNEVLSSGESTTSLMTSIILCKATDMGNYETTTYYIVAESTTVPADDAGWSTLKEGETLEDIQATVAVGQYLHIYDESTLVDGKEGYAGATYVLTVTSETLQATPEAVADAVAADDDAWTDYWSLTTAAE